MSARHVHLTGASGSGVSTLGQTVAECLGYDCFDTDDFYWLPTDPPYHTRYEATERLQLLSESLDGSERWVLGGSLMGWGDPLTSRFDLVVFLYLPSEERMTRLRRRERERFGSALDPGGAMHEHHRWFMDWAGDYDNGKQRGRSLAGHNAWLAALPCPVLRIEGSVALQDAVGEVLKAVMQVP